MAKEKTDDFAEGAKEAVQETKEAVLGESDDEKDRQKCPEKRYSSEIRVDELHISKQLDC
ncbi:hypothetical protein TRIUR3_25816 [Triticum urartu]|uniref:Uncharacterized protein n=1 Tax=Triticum urartu TaxID=4572 RepID=M8AKV5_TRIUA|nr:hypothetical protein TRIUR3_25816 [Triticum urartu]